MEAFAGVCRLVDEEILNKTRILKLSDLNEQYKEARKETPFANPTYRLSKLEKCDVYKQGNLTFCKVHVDGKGTFESYLVFSSQIGTETLCIKFENVKNMVLSH